MSWYTENADILALATAFVNQDNDPNGPNGLCTAIEVEPNGEEANIVYKDTRGYTHEWSVHPLELMAYGWNNPKV